MMSRSLNWCLRPAGRLQHPPRTGLRAPEEGRGRHTKQHPKVLLKRLLPRCDEGEPLSSRHQEADSEVSRILG